MRIGFIGAGKVGFSMGKYFAEHPDHFDPRQYLKPARQAVKDMVAHKIQYVLGSAGKA